MRTMNNVSIFNYRNVVKPKLTAREQWVLEAIEEQGTASVDTVAEYYGVGTNIISGRFTGLKNKGIIEPAYKGTNKLGSQVMYYKICQKLVEHCRRSTVTLQSSVDRISSRGSYHMTLIAKTDGTVWSTNYRNTGKTRQIKAFDNGRGYLSFVHSVGGKKSLS